MSTIMYIFMFSIQYVNEDLREDELFNLLCIPQ